MCVSPRIRPKPAQKGAERVKKNKGRSRFVALCVAPAVILFVIFMIVPTINVFRMSLFERGAYSPTETFVGLANFKALINDSLFIRSMQNTILLIVVVTMVTFAFALVFAGILTRENVKGKNIFRVIFYIPNILSVVVISGIFSAIYKPENGMLNSLLSMITGQTVTVLWKDAPLVMVSIIIAMVWQAIGYYMVMYMASMASVPQSLYESASLDGAGRVKQFFQITIPLIWTNIRTTLTFFIISTINMAFLFVKAMTSGGPNGASEVALSYMYGQKDAGLYGYSMAIGVVVFLFSFALSALVNRATKRKPLEF
ncbi:ABC transporter, permease protein [Pseudoflavonifractor capillosus ATCC 29799]|uniref:ABC transporter, permease protein n=1 Tax=Pseudoflavonifractor capillosus ATCC 29799 TaxID=411467 RepID=A6NS78_9FIRM|nr:ABC transporter, permease protein [Pseudoflavonifractor capillosus ATCC 29799]